MHGTAPGIPKFHIVYLSQDFSVFFFFSWFKVQTIYAPLHSAFFFQFLLGLEIVLIQKWVSDFLYTGGIRYKYGEKNFASGQA